MANQGKPEEFFFLATGPEPASLAAWYLTSHWNIFIEEEERTLFILLIMILLPWKKPRLLKPR
jgi:hypothetical protein